MTFLFLAIARNFLCVRDFYQIVYLHPPIHGKTYVHFCIWLSEIRDTHQNQTHWKRVCIYSHHMYYGTSEKKYTKVRCKRPKFACVRTDITRRSVYIKTTDTQRLPTRVHTHTDTDADTLTNQATPQHFLTKLFTLVSESALRKFSGCNAVKTSIRA